ncbi:MAG: hypothetical protein AAGN66_07245 [Acidobacteriota bacterium]
MEAQTILRHIADLRRALAILLGIASAPRLAAQVEAPTASASATDWLILFFVALILVAMVLWTWRTKWYRVVLLDRVALRASIAFVAGIFLITLLTHHFERHSETGHFDGPFESFWSITIYIFSGLEDREPESGAGKVFAALGLLIGPLYFAFMTGWLAKTMMQLEKLMPKHLTDHYLILNWSSRAVDLVRELHHPVIREREGNAVIVVLTDDEELSVKRLKDAGTGTDDIFEDFYISVGDPTAERALLNANAQDAKTILIFADERSGPHADEATIRSVIMLRRLAKERGVSSMHVVAELVNPANEQVLDEVASGFPGLLERVSGLQIRTCLMAQAVLNEGVVDFYTDLLSVSGDTNEVYVRPIPESAAGLTFREYGGRLMGEGSLEEPLIALGVQRTVNGRPRIFCNPRGDSPGAVLEAGDRLVVLAYEPPAAGVLP